MDTIVADNIHRLEVELGIDIYPGTEVLADTAGITFVKGAKGVLIPQPSDNPNDPLNWSERHKTGAVTCAILIGFLQGFGPLSLASQIPFYIEEFGVGVNDVLNYIGVAILVLGFSNFFWVPIATQFGRRTCAIASCVVCLASMIWRAKAQTTGSFLGACIFNGFGAGPAETLPPMIIADVIFLDRRGIYLSIYWFAYFGGIMVGPIVAGSISVAYGWRSFWWLNVGLFGGLILLILAFLPETKWERQESLQTTAISTVSKDEEKSADTPIAIVHVDDSLGKGSPNRAQYQPIQPFSGSMKLLLRDLVTPWTLFVFPIVQFSSFVVSFSSSCFLVLNLTQSFVFAAPPYNFSPSAVGFTNFAILGGAVLGLVSGPAGDYLSRWSTRRNNMIREPEMRLPSLWPFVVILAIGSSIVACGYQNQWDWKVIVILGYGLIGMQVAAIPSIAIAYSIDSYKPVSGEFLVAMTVNKNVWGYGVSQFIIPWILTNGFITPIMVNTGLTIIFTLVGSIALYYGGKRARGWTKNSYVHRM